MSRSRSLRSFRFRAWGLAAAGAVCAAIATTFACIVAPPPAPPTLQACRPIADSASAVPPAAPVVLTEWPTVFKVPVEVQSCDPTDGYVYNVFLDFDATNTGPVYQASRRQYPLNGGPALVDFQLNNPGDNGCHTIEVVVAHAFNNAVPHVPDTIGGSIVDWLYSPTGRVDGCPSYNAGDGSFPNDSSGDTLPFTPEGGGG